MKKKYLLGLALLAPIALLAGCGGTLTLGFSANWYYDNTVEDLTGKSERLEYKVTFTEYPVEGTSVHYEEGSYVTELTSETVDAKQVYRLHTEYTISGQYRNGGTVGETFDDAMTSDVWFRKASDGLRPLKSEKTVRATVPYSQQGSSEWYTTYVFTYNVSYADDLSSAEYALNITAPEAQKTDRTGTVKLGFDETFLDNEEIVIALRGLDFSSGTAYPFMTIDPQTQKPVGVRLSATTEATQVGFTLNGKEIGGSIDAAHVSVSYDMAQPGPTREFVYAVRKDEASREYRNVLLSFENDPIVYGLGKMTYTLVSATINDN